MYVGSSIAVLVFLDHYFTRCLSQKYPIPVPKLTKSLLFDVATLFTTNPKPIEDVKLFAFCQEEYKTLMGDFPPVNRAGLTNVLLYHRKGVLTICRNHIVSNVQHRVRKCRSLFIKSNLHFAGIKWKFPVTWLVNHLASSLEQDIQALFSIPRHSSFIAHLRKLNFKDFLHLSQKAFDRLKTEIVQQSPLQQADIVDHWNTYFPLLFRIQPVLEGYRDVWNAFLQPFSIEERRKVGRNHFRGRQLLKGFCLLPQLSDRWQCVMFDSFGLAQITDGQAEVKAAEDTHVVYKDIWRNIFNLEKIHAIVRAQLHLRHIDRRFMYMLRTDGVSAFLHVRIPQPSKPTVTRSVPTLSLPTASTQNLNVQECISRLLPTLKARPTAVRSRGPSAKTIPTTGGIIDLKTVDGAALLSFLLGMILLVVDGGKNPLFTAGAYEVADPLGSDGKLAGV
ncbi:hypothetical protein HDV00_011581 [Rhizophlyctis rosea]|nr:hypothetical protein HDV00_011581 [Rhizophlyctis rosea]